VALAGEVDAVEDVLFCRRAEPLHRLDLTGFGRGFEIVQILDAERLVEIGGGLRADPLDARDRLDIDRELLAELV